MAFKSPKQWFEEKALQIYIKSITGAQMFPVSQRGRPIYKEWDDEKAIKDGFKANAYVYAAVSKIGQNAGSVPWKVYKKTADGKKEEIPDHDLIKLINKPNQHLTRSLMMQFKAAHLYLSGNSVEAKVRGLGNTVSELWPIMPQYITPVPGNDQVIQSYQFVRGNIRKEILREDVTHTMFIDPSNIHWGMGKLQAVAKTVDGDNKASDWNRESFDNRAIPDGALVSDKVLSQPQYEEVKRQVDKKKGALSARELWVMSGGLKFEQFSLSPAEMDFIQTRKYNREEIAIVFDTPPPILGIMDKSTYNNMSEARKIYWQDTIIPFLNVVKDSWNHQLVPEFEKDGERLELDYDISNVPALQANAKEKSENAKSYWSMGVPFNEINKRLELGFDEIEGGDRGYIGSGLIPSDLDFGSIVAPPDDGNDEGKTKGAAAARQTKTATKEAAEEFDPYDEEIQRYLTLQAGQKITYVLDFTKQEIAAIITELEKEGANVDKIAKAIRAKYDVMGEHRAFRIARTEVSSGSNYGIFAAGKQANTGARKQWVNSSDDRVRDSHDFKEVVGIDDKFKNGLLYPGDMAGAAKEIIHCRCALAYVNSEKGHNLMTVEQKAIYWKSIERRRISWDGRFTNATRKRFKEEAKAVELAYLKDGKKGVQRYLYSKENKGAWAEMYLIHLKAIVKEFGENAFKDLKKGA